MKKKWYAKSKRPDGKQIEVQEHLEDVTTLGAGFGKALGMESEVEEACKHHDAAKCTDSFQGVLKQTNSRIDHAIASAACLWKMLIDTNKYTADQIGSSCYAPILEAISAHHSELRSYEELKPMFQACMQEQKYLESCSGKEVALTGEANYRELGNTVRAFYPQWKLIHTPLRRKKGEARMLWTRMLLSCLVDADYTASAKEDGEIIPEAPACDAEMWLRQLNDYREQLSKKSNADSKLNQLRNELFEACGRAGEGKPGIYTLTAPTGTGKTLALLHFALRQCIANGQRRIIIVLPFITLTEQNAAEYRKILGDGVLLEDHSQKQLTEEQRAFAQRWDMPVIATTSVRFFEGMFAAGAPGLRKLHQLANSVIVFDEAQSLPAELIPSTLRTVRALCEFPNRNVTMLFSTATQPDFQAIPGIDWHSTEVCPNNEAMYRALRRVQVAWRIMPGEQTPLQQIAREMTEEKSVCAIVNLKKHAKTLFEALKENCEPDTVFYMTTELCPSHRSAVIERIKARLADGLPCRVVATQCIEAGVDLDFDCVFRALAPLEAIIQAAGRCNRNGRLQDGGRVVVFVPDEEGELYPDAWYGKAAMQVRVLQSKKPIDLQDPSEIQRYYQRLFSQLREKRELKSAVQNQSYVQAEQAYRLIKNNGIQVLVPYAAELERFEHLKKEVLEHGVTAQWMREAAPLCVTVYANEQTMACVEKLCFHRKHGGQAQESGYYLLLNRDNYREDMGICFGMDFVW